MRVDGRGTRLQPNSRRMFTMGDDLAQNSNRVHSARHHLVQIGNAVATIDRSARQVDDNVGSVDFLCPVACGLAVPYHRANAIGQKAPATQNHDLPS